MNKINVNGTTLAYKEFGSGDKVLLSTQNFFFEDCHMELLGKPPYDYHVYLIYMRGYGESDHIYDQDPCDMIKIWGEDVLAFADAIGADKFYYSGVSHGCFAGWYTAFHQPQRLLGFAATSGICQFRDISDPSNLPPRRGPSIDWDKVVGNREALAKMSWNTYEPTNNPDRLALRAKRVEEHLDIMVNRKKEEFLVNSTSMSGSDAKTQEEFDRQLSDMQVPLLIVNGVLDTLSTVEKALHVAKLVPGAKMITYQHLGHAGPDECPELVACDCDRFFHDIEGRVL